MLAVENNSASQAHFQEMRLENRLFDGRWFGRPCAELGMVVRKSEQRGPCWTGNRGCWKCATQCIILAHLIDQTDLQISSVIVHFFVKMFRIYLKARLHMRMFQ